MITATVSLAMHIITSSYQGVQTVGRILSYVLPYSSMAVKNNINFNTKHLKTGDALPPFTGKPRVYNMRFCPYAQRTILALNAKEIDYEVINIDLVDKPEWLTSKSAFAKVPAIELKEGETIYESLVTVEFLDDVYPQRPLLPKDPVKKAFDKIIVESIGPIQTIYFKSVKAPDTITEDNISAYNKALDFLQSQLKSRGSKFLDGSEPGYADYMIWPWFERVLTYDKGHKCYIEPKTYILLREYLNHMLADPAVSQYVVPKEIFDKFHTAYSAGVKPDYDILSE